ASGVGRVGTTYAAPGRRAASGGRWLDVGRMSSTGRRGGGQSRAAGSGECRSATREVGPHTESRGVAVAGVPQFGVGLPAPGRWLIGPSRAVHVFSPS